jgi:hypothetical protein
VSSPSTPLGDKQEILSSATSPLGDDGDSLGFLHHSGYGWCMVAVRSCHGEGAVGAAPIWYRRSLDSQEQMLWLHALWPKLLPVWFRVFYGRPHVSLEI